MEKKTDRQYFYIDVSKLPKSKAEEYIRKYQSWYRKVSFKEILEREDPPLKENS
jgi:hypothetical protein